MRIFKLDDDYSIVCNFVKTRSGFKHTASLCRHRQEVLAVKECYLNRTWESFEYESVILKVINNYFSDILARTTYLSIVSNSQYGKLLV